VRVYFWTQYINCLLVCYLHAAQPCRNCVNSMVRHRGFRPTGATHWSNKREIWHGAADRTAALPWQISKIRILPTYLPIGADSFAQFFYEILSICTRLQVAFNLLIWPLYGHKQPSYRHFPAVWAFSHRFSIASSGKNYWSDPKKLGMQKMVRTSSITTPSIVGIVGRAPAVNAKVWCFFVVFLSRFRLTKFIVTERLLCSVIFKTNMVPLHTAIAIALSCSCAPIFTFFYGPLGFSLRKYQKNKIYHFWWFWGL